MSAYYNIYRTSEHHIMSSDDEGREEVICAVCLHFEPQAWRKKFCKNCFHSLDEHAVNTEKESGDEKIENEKNEKKTIEKDDEDKTDKLSKDKFTKDDQNKNKPSTEKQIAETDKSNTQQTGKTSALSDKVNKKLSGVSDSVTNKSDDKKVEPKTSATDKLKSKFETDKKQPDSKTDDIPKQTKENSDKSKQLGAKTEQSNVTDKETKTDSKDNSGAGLKSKSWGSKSKFESKSDEVKEKGKKDETSDDISKGETEKQVAEDEKKAGIKTFKPPQKPESKLKWKEMWGTTLPSVKDEKTKEEKKETQLNETDTKSNKTDEKSNEKEDEKSKSTEVDEKVSRKDAIKSKFESKETGSLWGITKAKGDSKKDEKTADNKKIEVDDKKDEKPRDKSDADKAQPKNGDKVQSNEADKTDSKDKSKFGGKITIKDGDKPKSDKVPSQETEKSKFGDKMSKDSSEKSLSNNGKVNLQDKDNKSTPKESDRLKSEIKDAKNKLETSKGEKEKSKIELLKSQIDNKNSSKFDKKEDTKTNKGFGVELKKHDEKAESKSTDGSDKKSDMDNMKNEKLEGKLKLDIKKADNFNKSGKDTSVGHSLADRLKDKYEKISKTPTSTTPSKTPNHKVYMRSKSDGGVVEEKPPDKNPITSPEIKTLTQSDKNPITSTEIKTQVQSDKKDNKISTEAITDDRKSALLQKDAKPTLNKPTQDPDKNVSDTRREVKVAETIAATPSLPKSSKLNTDDINKIKDAAKSLLLDDDFDDVIYNSVGRRNNENKSTPSQQETTSLSSSAKSQSGARAGTQDKSLNQGTISNKGNDSHDGKNGVNERFNSEAERLKKQLKLMEARCSELEEENKNLKNGLVENEKHSGRLMKQKQDVENSIKVLQKSLSSIESKCSKLEIENANLIERIKQAQVKCNGNMSIDLKEAHMAELDHLRDRLKEGESIVDELKEDNETLRQEILDLKGEMEEMYDTFRDQEAEEFREVQREMEMHAKNCRVLSFKLRKYERSNEQLEAEKENCEEKLRMLQNQISDGDIRAHVRDIEDELRLAKEVSVRLHDELDILEEKKCKCEDENHQLTQILEQSDKKQFRLELELDKLRDQLAELKKKGEKSIPGTPVSQDDIKDRRL